MAKMGRKNKYWTHVEPHLKEITEYKRTMTEAQICKKLGVGRSAFNEYKKQHPELVAALRAGTVDLISDLKGALIQKALGYDYEETTEITGFTAKGPINETKTITKHMPPDLGSIHLLLKNIDPTWRNDDSTTLQLKRAELEIKKKRAEEAEW